MPNCGKQSTWLFWGPYVMSAKTKYPEQAWTVLKALTSPEVQAQVAALGTNIPSNKAQAAVDAFMNSKPPDDNTALHRRRMLRPGRDPALHRQLGRYCQRPIPAEYR